MKRRELLKGVAMLPFLAGFALSETSQPTSNKNKIIKPKRLLKGDTVGLVAPAGYVGDVEFNRAVQNIENLGFKVKAGKNTRKQNGYLAGTDSERLEDLHSAFSDAEIKAVWCIRGGYGITRLLPALNFGLIKKNPKIVIGYSDITALLLAIHQNTGLVTFHGPVASSDYNDYSKNNALTVLMNPTAPYKIELSDYNKSQTAYNYKTEIITAGKAKGKLIGGNLSLLAAVAGTPFALKDIKRKLLFIEDVNEPPYKVDRLLTQLLQCVDMRSLAGIALGVFEESRATETKPVPSAVEIIKERLGNLGIPVIYGLSFGHIRTQFTLPLGIEAELDTENAAMTFLESGVA